LAVARRRKGDRAMKSRQCASRTATSFLIARSLGEPISSRNSLSVVTTCLNMRPPLLSRRLRASSAGVRRPAASSDEPVLQIARAGLRWALRRRPEATAARRLHQEHVAGPHEDPDLLGLEHTGPTAAREEPVPVRKPILTPEEAIGRVTHAIPRGVRDRRLLDVHAEPEHGAHPAPIHAVPARVGAKLVVLERERKARLGDFHAPELDPARRLPFARGLPTVALGAGTATRARVEHVPDQRAPGARVHALDRDAQAPAPARDGARG